MEKWENIDIINEHQLPSHATLHHDRRIDLNGIWKIRCFLNPDQSGVSFISDHEDLSGYQDIDVPSCIEPQGFSKPYYFGAGFPAAVNTNAKKIPQIDHKKTYCAIYKKEFEITDFDETKQYILRFDSVKSAFYCYLNEEYVGLSKGSMLPCEFDVTRYLKQGTNHLTVKVHQFSDATYIEDQDMWFLSGIYRDVSLYQREKDHIEDVYLHCDLINGYKDALLHCEVKTSAPGTLTLKLGDLSVSKETGSSLSLEVKDVSLWSAEKPDLYDVEVIYENGNIKESQSFRFGFREDKVDHEKALYLHNGKPIKIRGINYHAFTPDKGYYVSEDVYRKDLLLMKQANINAIRTSHYPQADIFYDLCDELGFYVMDECNVESHGVREKNVPGDDPRWARHVIDRMERMVLRDRNHACVSIWSLGNESACGANHFKMKEKALSLDASRPIHYEGGRNLQLSDFLCDGYCSTQREQQFADKEDIKDKPTIVQRFLPLLMSLKSISYEEYKHHPIIVTEYQHAMGNAGSEVSKHVKIMDGCDQYCGGYVWDFKDKCLLKDGQLTYGGDWGVKDQGSHFCANGICDAFSRPHSIYYEIQHGFQPIQISRNQDGSLRIYNRNFFLSTSAYRSYYQVCKEGEVLFKKDFSSDIGPRETKDIVIDLPEMKEDSVYLLNVFFEKDGASSYQQFVLKDREIQTRENETLVREKDGLLILNDSYGIDAKTGDLVSVLVDGENILKGKMKTSFFRPYTDGDMGFIGLSMKRHRKIDAFGKLSLSGFRKKPQITVRDGKVFVSDGDKLFDLHRTYEVIGGKLHVTASAVFHKTAPRRFGMYLTLDPSFDTMEYFGKGESDHYPGKDDSGLIGTYTWKIEEQDEYVRPQEHGNKSHVCRSKIKNGRTSLSIEKGRNDLNISFWPYSLKTLQDAQHIYDLRPNDVTTVNIDCIQNGMSDCFVACGEEYRIKTEQEYSYDFYISADQAV